MLDQPANDVKTKRVSHRRAGDTRNARVFEARQISAALACVRHPLSKSTQLLVRESRNRSVMRIRTHKQQQLVKPDQRLRIAKPLARKTLEQRLHALRFLRTKTGF